MFWNILKRISNPAKARVPFLAFGLFGLLVFGPLSVSGDTIEDLRNQISARQDAIKDLEAEIAKTQADIDKSQSAQKTLANAVKTYDNQRKKLLAEINVTENKIEATELEIESLGISIDEKTKVISRDLSGLSELIRYRDSFENQTTFSAFLNSQSLSEYWDSLRQAIVLSETISGRLGELKDDRLALETNQADAISKKNELSNLRRELSGQKEVSESVLASKQKLLKETKNQESAYQKILSDQLAKKTAFEQELLSYESQLNFAIDPNSIPAAGAGVLKWPLDTIKITQYFGNTEFAATHTQVYNGSGHNGVDFGAAVGTPVKAAEKGIVKGFGNTDLACAGASYGKWVLIEHQNGLSTLYAHLSVISVSEGESVALGDTIGLSGNTGYTTGPHLHFTVYATQGVKIMDRQSKVCGGIYHMPIADLKAYLNPLSYL